MREARRLRKSYDEFFDQYDHLIGLLCGAAHTGIKLEHEKEYRTRRAWFMRRYPVLKQTLGAYLVPDPSDSFPIVSGRRSCDAFEALYMPLTIASMLKDDDGDLISRMMRTQNALYEWDGDVTAAEAVNQVKSPTSEFNSSQPFAV